MTEAALNPAVDRFEDLDEEEQDEYRDDLRTFTRLYSFRSQVATWTDLDLEKWYIYCRALLLKLKDHRGSAIDVSDQVELTHLVKRYDWFVVAPALRRSLGVCCRRPLLR
ncbi:MAG: hypothetical protein R2823_03415 [Acidimicrobiia bacterium]